MPNEKNLNKVEELKEKLAKAKSVVFAEYHGLDANQTSDLRMKINENGGEMTVAKNTLMKIALKEENMGSDELDENLEGPVATFFAYEDAISPIKALVDFAKELELPKIKAGIFEGKFANLEKIKVLSELPSKEELLARVVGGLKSPISGFVNALGGTRNNLVYVLSAVADKKSEQESN